MLHLSVCVDRVWIANSRSTLFSVERLQRGSDTIAKRTTYLRTLWPHHTPPSLDRRYHLCSLVTAAFRGQGFLPGARLRRSCGVDVLRNVGVVRRFSSRPENWQLRAHALRSAVPMVGFGLVDCLVMTQVGSTLELMLGASLGISSITAAAIGLFCSDSCGVLFGRYYRSFRRTHGTSHAAIRGRPTQPS